MSQVEPMTAAEWDTHRRIGGTALTPMWDKRIAAALEEREALLGEREEWGKLSGQTIQDAAVGALVRRIREHPMVAGTALRVSPKRGPEYPFDDFWRLNEDGLSGALAALDSLLPKEPEVVTGKSGRQYRTDCGQLEVLYAGPGIGLRWERCDSLPVEDAPVAAKLLESAKEVGK